MKFFKKTKPQYLETDAFGIGLGTALLQTRKGMTCSKDAAPDNTILKPITFASKNLTSTEKSAISLKERCWVYCIILKKFTIIALLGR